MIGIVFCNDLNICPYIDKYFQVLKEKNIEYEVIIWNRAGGDKPFQSNFQVFNEQSDIHIPRWKKIGAFLRFRKFLNDTIKTRRYDKLIMLTTIPAIMCYGLLTRKYEKRYIFDFRDLSYERFGFYRKKVLRIIKKSAFTCISSPGFADILHMKEYVMAHNFRYSDLGKKVERPNLNKQVINLLHIGITRGEEYNRKLVDIFGNDDRFTVNIVGSGNDTTAFLDYTKGVSNFNVVGTYNNEDKQKYINDATMLLYYYPCDFNCNRALANKYYDGLIYKKPLIGNINTYSGKRLADKGLGISLDIDDPDFANKIYEYVQNLDTSCYIDAVNDEMDLILSEDRIYLDRISQFLEE